MEKNSDPGSRINIPGSQRCFDERSWINHQDRHLVKNRIQIYIKVKAPDPHRNEKLDPDLRSAINNTRTNVVSAI
jgi:hypothetical protein